MALKSRNRIIGLVAAILFLCYAGFLLKQDSQTDHSGWHSLTTGLGYRNFHGEFVTGWQEIDGEHYHFRQPARYCGYRDFTHRKLEHLHKGRGLESFHLCRRWILLSKQRIPPLL